jgi:hypothetical protein
MNTNKNLKTFVLLIILLLSFGVIAFYLFSKSEIKYSSDLKISDYNILSKEEEKKEVIEEKIIEEINTIPVSHIETPEPLKALYISSWVAGSPKFRDSIIKIIDETEINAIVIDIKDSTGKISFKIDDPFIKEINSAENRIGNILALTELLHKKNIYIIGRISVFQDPYLANKKPEWAITRLSDGGVWKDKKGLSFLDPTKKEVLDYTISIAKASYDLGFDEMNFDYIRYPSDGNMKDINYKLKEGETRADNMEKFFKNLNTEMKKDVNIPISADLFGLTTEAKDDMGIGQLWEKTIKYFDYVCPMVYPSHYPKGHMGYTNPALSPYEVINQALKGAIAKTKAIEEDPNKIRPWLQDFDLGAIYTKELVRAQIKATNDNSLSSWMLWDPSNKYTPSALIKEN